MQWCFAFTQKYRLGHIKIVVKIAWSLKYRRCWLEGNLKRLSQTTFNFPICKDVHLSKKQTSTLFLEHIMNFKHKKSSIRSFFLLLFFILGCHDKKWNGGPQRHKPWLQEAVFLWWTHILQLQQQHTLLLPLWIDEG